MMISDTKQHGRLARKKEKTKALIIDIAVTLFKTLGVDNTTMEQIADQADIAKGTLYNYFPTKEAIINEYMQRSFRIKMQDRISSLSKLSDTRARLVFLLSELVEGISENKDIFEKFIMYQTKNMLSFTSKDKQGVGFAALGDQIIMLGQQGGELRCDLPAWILRELFEFIFVEIIKQYYDDDEKARNLHYIEKHVDLFMNGAAIK